MILPTKNFKVRLTSIPKTRESKDSELKNYGTFTLRKKYQIYSVYTTDTTTEFLVADDTGEFIWIATGAFRKS